MFCMGIPDGRTGPGVADVWFYTIGGRNQRTVEATEIGLTLERNQPGELTASFPLSLLAATFGTAAAMVGRWVRWYGVGMAPFGGVVTTVDGDPSSDTAVVTCQDFTYNLAKRLLPRNARQVVSGYAGEVAAKLLTIAAQDDTLWLTDVVYDATGTIISNELTGQDLLGQLQQNADDAGQQFYIDANRVLYWGNALGRDLTRTVQLTEGREIASFTLTFDGANVVNDLIVTPSDDRYAARYARRVEADASIAAIGRRQDRMIVSDAIRPSVIQLLGDVQLATSARLGQTLSLDIVNENAVFSRFGLNDTVRVVLPSQNLAADFEIQQLGYTLSDNTIIATGGFV